MSRTHGESTLFFQMHKLFSIKRHFELCMCVKMQEVLLSLFVVYELSLCCSLSDWDKQVAYLNKLLTLIWPALIFFFPNAAGVNRKCKSPFGADRLYNWTFSRIFWKNVWSSFVKAKITLYCRINFGVFHLVANVMFVPEKGQEIWYY